MRGHSVLEAAASELLGGRKFASSFSGPSSSSELSSSPRERWKMQHFLDFLRHKSSLSTTSSAQRTRDRRRFSLSVRCVGAVASVCAAATVLTVTTVVEPAWLAASPTTISPRRQRRGRCKRTRSARGELLTVPQAHVRRSLSTRLSRSWLRCMTGRKRVLESAGRQGHAFAAHCVPWPPRRHWCSLPSGLGSRGFSRAVSNYPLLPLIRSGSSFIASVKVSMPLEWRVS